MSRTKNPLQNRWAASRRSPVPLSFACRENHQTIILRLRRTPRRPRFSVCRCPLLRPANATRYLAGRVVFNGSVCFENARSLCAPGKIPTLCEEVFSSGPLLLQKRLRGCRRLPRHLIDDFKEKPGRYAPPGRSKGPAAGGTHGPPVPPRKRIPTTRPVTHGRTRPSALPALASPAGRDDVSQPPGRGAATGSLT